jgi:hypothetical protein
MLNTQINNNNFDQSLIDLLDNQLLVTYRIDNNNKDISIEYPTINISLNNFSFGAEIRKVRWCNKISLEQYDVFTFGIIMNKEIYNCDYKYNFKKLYDSLISGSVNIYGDEIETYTYIETPEDVNENDEEILDNLHIDIIDDINTFNIIFRMPIRKNMCNIYGFDYTIQMKACISKHIHNKKCGTIKIPINYSSYLEFIRGADIAEIVEIDEQL